MFFKTRNETRVSTLSFFFNIVFDVLAGAIRQDKEISRKGTGQIILYFADDMTYIYQILKTPPGDL